MPPTPPTDRRPSRPADPDPRAERGGLGARGTTVFGWACGHSMAGLLVALMAGLVVGLTGCGHGHGLGSGVGRGLITHDASSVIGLPDLEHLTWDQIALDIQNPRGSVRVEVDPTLERPVVRSTVRWAGAGTPLTGEHGAGADGAAVGWGESNPPARVWAIPEAGPVGRVALRVGAELAGGAPERTEVDITVRTPRCDGVRVSNAYGPVVLIGVGGAITVENGSGGRPGGRIELRTGRDIIDPVALVTTSGRVSAVLTPASRGEVDLYTEEGSASFIGDVGGISRVRPGPRRWRAVWNDGANPLVVRSERGDVRVLVVESPETYSITDGLESVLADGRLE